MNRIDWWKLSLCWTWFVPRVQAKRIATLGMLGYRMPAPGTWGSLLGVFFYQVVFHPFPWFWQLLFLTVGIFLAIGLCDKAEQTIGRRDPREIILDEFSAMPLCFIGTRGLAPEINYGWVLLLGFLLFRFFDIAKPLGIQKLQQLPGGWGIVIDDLGAALATWISLQLLLFRV